MQEADHLSVVRGSEGAISREELLEAGEEVGLECVANGSKARGRSDDGVGGVSRAKSSGQILDAQEGERLTDRQEFRLPMKVLPRGYPQGAPGNPESRVLDDLQEVQGRVRGICEPDRCRIGKDWIDECLVREYQVLLRLTPAHAG